MQSGAKVPLADESTSRALEEVQERLRSGDVSQASEFWRRIDYAPFPNEEWEGVYSALRRVATYREEVLQAQYLSAQQKIAELQRVAASRTKSLSELQSRTVRSSPNRTAGKQGKEPAEVAVLRTQVGTLTDAVEARNAEINELAAELDLAHREVERLSILSAQAKALGKGAAGGEDVLRLLTEVQELKEERKDMKKQLDDCERLRDIIKDREKTIEELMKRGNKEAVSELKALQKHLSELENQHLEELERLRAQFHTEQHLRDASEARSKAFESYHHQAKSQKATIDELQTTLASMETVKQELEKTNGKVIAENAELRSRVIVLEQQSGSIQQSLRKADRNQSALEDSYQEAKSAIFSQEQTMRRMTEMQEELQQEIDRLRTAELQYKETEAMIRSQFEASQLRCEELEKDMHRLSEVFSTENSESRQRGKADTMVVDLQSSLDENELLYQRLRAAEVDKARFDEVSTELEILKSEHSQCAEDARVQSAAHQHQLAALSASLKAANERLATTTSDLNLTQAGVRLKEEEIVGLNSLIEQYKRQVQDCRDLLLGQLPHSKTAKAYAAGMAQDWDLIGKIGDQLKDIDSLKEKNAILEGKVEELQSDLSQLRKLSEGLNKENEALREENTSVAQKCVAVKRRYKDRLKEFQNSLDEQQSALRRSYEELGRKSDEFQQEMHRYTEQREKEKQRAKERERELRLSFQKDTELETSRSDQFTEEIRRLNEITRKSISSVSELADTIGRLFEEWHGALPFPHQSSIKSQKISSQGELTTDLNAIKHFVSSLLSDFSHIPAVRAVEKERKADTTLEYESTLDFAQRLLQRFDMEGGHVEDALVVQLIKEKLGLERELLKKSEQLLKDERFFHGLEGQQDEESRQSWAIARWQESESETYRLRTLFMENSKRLEDYFNEKGVNTADGETIAELRSQLKLLRKENQAKEALIKSFDSGKGTASNAPPSQSMLAQKSSYESLISDMRAQQAQLRSSFEGKEKAWKDAFRTIKDNLQSHFALDEATLAKIDYTASPSSFASILITSINHAKKKSSDDSTEQNRYTAQLKAELDSWVVKEESWTQDRTNLQKALDRAHSEVERTKEELAKTREMVDKLMAELRELARRAETEIPEEAFKRGVVEGELRGKKEQKRLKAIVADYKDLLDALRVKYEGLQDQILSLTSQNSNLLLDKESMHEELYSRIESQTRSRILEKRRSLLSRQISAVRPDDQESVFEPPRPQEQTQVSLLLSTSRDRVNPTSKDPQPAILEEKEVQE